MRWQWQQRCPPPRRGRVRRGEASESMLRAARIASRRSPLCATAPVGDYAVNCAARRFWRATRRYGEAGTKWRGRLVPRAPLGRTVPAGAVKYAQRGTSGGFPALRNLLGFAAGSLLAQGQLPALCGKGKCVGGRPHERVSGGHRLRPSPQSCLALG